MTRGSYSQFSKEEWRCRWAVASEMQRRRAGPREGPAESVLWQSVVGPSRAPRVRLRRRGVDCQSSPGRSQCDGVLPIWVLRRATQYGNRSHAHDRSQFTALKAAGQKITMLTAYDYPMAALLDAAGIEGDFGRRQHVDGRARARQRRCRSRSTK